MASLIQFVGYRGVNAKVSVALLTAFSNDLQILQKQTTYDLLINPQFPVIHVANLVKTASFFLYDRPNVMFSCAPTHQP